MLIRMKRIAVTGGIAEGKSTVLRMIADEGAVTLSADEIAAKIRNLPEVRSEILHAFGTVDRDQLRSLLATVEDRQRLNSILHPHILSRLLTGPPGFYEVPLLFETCIQAEWDEVWVVTCGASEQRRRLVERLGTDVDVASLLRSQIPTSVKVVLAHRVFRTNLPLVNVRDHVKLALSATV
jgi:dephospho-CoA kinase